jgi:hypothetical protein
MESSSRSMVEDPYKSLVVVAAGIVAAGETGGSRGGVLAVAEDGCRRGGVVADVVEVASATVVVVAAVAASVLK